VRKNTKEYNNALVLPTCTLSISSPCRSSPPCRPKILKNIDMRDPDSGWTALHFAARNGQVEFARRLLEAKADVNALGPSDETPLHLASGWGTKETVGLLLQCGADKTMKYLGKTPLTIAKENMREDIAKLLAGWMRVGLGYKKMAELSEPPPKDYSEESDNRIATQLRALDMKIALSGRFHIGLVHSYAKLAKLYREGSPPRWEEAIESGKRIVEIRRHALQSVGEGGDGVEENVMLAAAMNNLGELCHAAEDYPNAKRYLSAALETMTNLRGADHQSTLPVLLNYANHLLESGAYDDARPLLTRYCETQRKLHTHEVSRSKAKQAGGKLF
jgi:tetratricopeptide (TPR) repeat protein